MMADINEGLYDYVYPDADLLQQEKWALPTVNDMRNGLCYSLIYHMSFICDRKDRDSNSSMWKRKDEKHISL